MSDAESARPGSDLYDLFCSAGANLFVPGLLEGVKTPYDAALVVNAVLIAGEIVVEDDPSAEKDMRAAEDYIVDQLARQTDLLPSRLIALADEYYDVHRQAHPQLFGGDST